MEENKHLIILQHGLHGSADDYNVMSKLIIESHPTLIVAKCSSSSSYDTRQGIDLCGDKLYQEIIELTKQHSPNKISIIGHSLGGLITRYAIGKLYEHGYFNDVQPIQFISLSSPHCGSRRPKSTVFNKIACMFTENLISVTGRQLMLADDPDNPLLLKLTDMNGPYYQGLSIFKRRVLYSNILNDIQVNFCTSDLSHRNPYTKEGAIEMIFSTKYPHIIDTDKQALFVGLSDDAFKNDEKGVILRQLLTNLQTLDYERYHCYFKNFLSHTNVVVKREYLNSDGLCVIHHFIDNLLIE